MTVSVDAFLVPNNMAVYLFLQEKEREIREKLAWRYASIQYLEPLDCALAVDVFFP
jgi:hypothetical protein